MLRRNGPSFLTRSIKLTRTGRASVRVPAADLTTQSGAGSGAKVSRGDVTECFATTALWAERYNGGICPHAQSITTIVCACIVE